ncbi:hypothetical protein [Sinorhizobium saheli]|jgi:hypothetical protein|uniref:Uncharacterized protein n=1 Tax=Sinorhizobium saheli TaxID=36856 RepID=A0A178Y4Q0_SINSA|nr:hypothetical protein [Sinorhizobium saheli]MQW85642.1 hypothetical protein [Sinorhizobium saheli]OAP41993.1 hypothetical protein ATB98_06125 [Sinorhizobium saheli]
MRTITLCALALLLWANSHAADRTIQIPGHKFRTAENCVRRAPIGKFDRKCDIPIVGWRGAEGLWLPSVSQGAPGGFGF